MKRRQALVALAAAVACAAVRAQPVAAPIKIGQRAVGRFMPSGSREVLLGEFAITEVKGLEIAGRFSGHLCGPNAYDFKGRFDGEVLEARSTSRWGPISVAARRVSEGKYGGSFAGRIPGKVEIEIVD